MVVVLSIIIIIIYSWEERVLFVGTHGIFFFIIKGAKESWVELFRLFGVEWVMLRRVIKLLVGWRGQEGSHDSLEVWRMAPMWLIWSIWRKQIAWIFEDCKILVVELKSIMFKSFYTWMAEHIIVLIF
jgi:hypothetical protein